jgi:LysR family transcriptional regulator, nitrogen assimilation regulatory protein
MNSRQLEYFRLVCEAQSLSKASLTIGVTQPALSKHIRDLEDELGVQLFHRTGRGVEPTPEGTRLFEHATAIMDRMTLAKEEARRSRNALLDCVAIGVTPTISRMLVGTLTIRMMEEFPGIKLRFIEGFSAHLLEGLTNGQIDVALLYDSGAAHRLFAEPIFEECLHLVAPATDPPLPPQVPFTRLTERPLILPATPFGLRALIDTIASKAGIQLDASVEVDGFSAMIDLVIAGIGRTILPGAVVRREIESAKLQITEIVEPPIVRQLVLATGINRARLRQLPSVVSIIKAEARSAYGARATRRCASGANLMPFRRVAQGSLLMNGE